MTLKTYIFLLLGLAFINACASAPPQDKQSSFEAGVKPVYPAASLERGEKGVVVVAVLIDKSGVPTDVKVDKSSGFERLDAAALSAVSRWRFVTPAVKSGVAVDARLLVPVQFSH